MKEAWTELKHASRHYFCDFVRQLRSSLINGDEGHVSHLYISVNLAPPPLPLIILKRGSLGRSSYIFPAIIFACAGDVVRF